MFHGDARQGDARQEVADDPVVRDCEDVRRLHAACRDGMARLGGVGVDDPATAEGAAAVYWQARLSVEYEGRALRLQERPACGSRGLVAKGEQLEKLLDYKAACMDDDLRRAVMLYLADVRRVAGAHGLARDYDAAGQRPQGRPAWKRGAHLRAIGCSPSLATPEMGEGDQA